MNYGKNLQVVISASRKYPKEERSVEIISNHGSILVDLMTCQILYYSKFDDAPQILKYEKRDHIYLEQDGFYRAILEDCPVPVNFKDGEYAVKIMDSISKSLLEEKEIILSW